MSAMPAAAITDDHPVDLPRVVHVEMPAAALAAFQAARVGLGGPGLPLFAHHPVLRRSSCVYRLRVGERTDLLALAVPMRSVRDLTPRCRPPRRVSGYSDLGL